MIFLFFVLHLCIFLVAGFRFIGIGLTKSLFVKHALQMVKIAQWYLKHAPKKHNRLLVSCYVARRVVT